MDEDTKPEVRRLWLERRKITVGASEAATILGIPGSYGSAYALWAAKSGLVETPEEETEQQRWGHVLEPAICEEYAAQTGRKIIDHGRYAYRRSETCSAIGATLDREVYADDKQGPGPLEAKNAGAYKDSEWEDGAPLIYQVQLQAQLEVTGWAWGSLAVLIGGNKFRWLDMERNENFINMLREKCTAFMRLVETRTPPPVDGSDKTADVLRKMFPKDSGEAVALPGEAIGWDDEIRSANEIIKAAEEKKQLAQNKIKAAMGSAAFGVLPSGGRYSLKTTIRKGHTVEQSETRTLWRLAK